MAETPLDGALARTLNSMPSRTRLVVLLVSMPVVAFVVIGGFLGKVIAREGPYQHLRVFEDVVSLIVSNYVEQVDVDEVMRGAMRGLADGLDSDSAYLSPEQVGELDRGARLPDGDVGLTLTRQYYLRVIAARDDSPAARAGLRSGDFVRAIDGEPTRDVSVFEGTRMLRGTPGSEIILTIIRGNAADPREVPLVREERPSTLPVSGRMAARRVGYIRVPAFGPSVDGELRARAAELTREGATALIVDLRNTAEGPLEAGVRAARLFVRSGVLAERERRQGGSEPILARAGDGTITLPMAVLVNNGTAGAAEVLAAALQDSRRGELIGERTTGQAAEQELARLPDGSGLWLSVTRYRTPAGDPLHQRGLEPDVPVDEPAAEFGITPTPGDPILEKALERLSNSAA